MKLDRDALRVLLNGHQIASCSLARASGLAAATVAAILGGYEPLGVKRGQRLQEALRVLGFSDKEVRTVFAQKDSEATA